MEVSAWLVIAVVIVGGLLYARIKDRADAQRAAEHRALQFQRRLEEAKKAYQAALRELTTDPTSPAKKQRTLELGRAYAALTREGGSVTIFDEMALGNDISAATAAATAGAVVTPAPAPAPAPAVSSRQRLAQLAELKDQGLITEDEYRERRKAILDAI